MDFSNRYMWHDGNSKYWHVSTGLIHNSVRRLLLQQITCKNRKLIFSDENSAVNVTAWKHLEVLNNL